MIFLFVGIFGFCLWFFLFGWGNLEKNLGSRCLDFWFVNVIFWNYCVFIIIVELVFILLSMLLVWSYKNVVVRECIYGYFVLRVGIFYV